MKSCAILILLFSIQATILLVDCAPTDNQNGSANKGKSKESINKSVRFDAPVSQYESNDLPTTSPSPYPPNYHLLNRLGNEASVNVNFGDVQRKINDSTFINHKNLEKKKAAIAQARASMQSTVETDYSDNEYADDEKSNSKYEPSISERKFGINLVDNSRAQPRSQNGQPRSQNDEPRSQNYRPKSQNDEPRSQNGQPRSQNGQPRSQNYQPTPSKLIDHSSDRESKSSSSYRSYEPQQQLKRKTTEEDLAFGYSYEVDQAYKRNSKLGMRKQ